MKKILPVALLAILNGCTVNSDGNSTENLGETAQALGDALGATFSIDGSIATIRTDEMPITWFPPTQDYFPNVRLDWSMPATSCSSAANGSFLSPNDGTFVPDQQPGSRILGYWWVLTQDLTGLEDHWHFFTACDGSITPSGCAEPRMVSYTLTVYGEYSAANGPITLTGSAPLPSIYDHDKNTLDPNCPAQTATCDIDLGSCVSWCQGQCNVNDVACQNDCQCFCKGCIHELNESCPIPPKNCPADTSGHGKCSDIPTSVVYTPNSAIFTPNLSLQ
jgi:hypothetical protein